MSWWKIFLLVVGICLIGAAGVGWYFYKYAELDMYVPLFADHCGGCHGDDLKGGARALPLLEIPLKGGDSIAELTHSISQKHPDLGRPAFADVLTDVEIKGLAIYIAERRLGQRFTEFQFDRELHLSDEVQRSEVHDFRMETVAEGLDPMVFSIEPLPDGSLLLSEKERGLSFVSAGGVQSPVVEGTPETGGSIDLRGVQYGSGWLLDVAAHPDYATNGWVYLHYTELCGEPCGSSVLDASMNRLDRGRIVDGRWVDVETIWQSPRLFYVATPDTGAGGRIAFDGNGHVFISVGIKSTDATSDTTAQDLDKPYGKIHRINDDGSIPEDNPFAVAADSVKRSIWTYGHRSPQGLEWNPLRGAVWNSEMGPRGGDEINELLPGKNYGWPYVSHGLEYIGGYVERHKLKRIEFDASDTVQPLVDITPSPGISSFAFYSGDAFPRWQNDVLIGSLKGSSLFRMVFDGDRFLHRETLIRDLARIRDVEIGYDGLVYVLLENKGGSAIVRIAPD